MSALLIVGAGGHGKIVADLARELGRWNRIAFLDDKFPGSDFVNEWEILGRIADAPRFLAEFPEAIVAIGANAVRLEVLRKMLEMGYRSPALIHPAAVVSRSATLGVGTVVCVQAAVDIDSEVGMGVIVNAGSTIAHDCRIGDGVHVSPGGRVSGGVTLGSCTWVGSGAVIKEKVTIGNKVVVGAGSVVIRDLQHHVTVVGVPGRIIRHSPEGGPLHSSEYD